VRSSSRDPCLDNAEADRAVFFIEEYCRHVQGPLAGQPFQLAPWQRRVTRRLFGQRVADGRRQHRFLWVEVPRKSGKSTFAAALGLYMLIVDPEPAAEIVIAAASVEQAAIVFDIARRMVEIDADLAAVCRITKRAIHYKDARLRLVSPRGDQLQGGDVSCLIMDEVQTQATRDLHDQILAGMAARPEPLAMYFTTAGCDRTSLAWHLHRYARGVDAGTIDDPAWIVERHAAADTDDWRDPKVWARVHPGLGTIIGKAFIEQECRRAQETPAFVDTFRRLYLNVWTDGASRWLDMDRWDACGLRTVNPHTLIGRPCRAGLDLSSTTDLTALVLAFANPDGGYTVLPFAFCPNDTIDLRSRRDRVDYRQWRDQGYLIATDGNMVDHAAVRLKILELARLYRIEELGFDRWNASMLVNQLLADGINCVPVSQVASAMNAPARELERTVANGKLRHGDHPVLRWCAGNVCAEQNAAGEIRPAKHRSTERIDLISATLMALSRHIYNPGSLRSPRRGAAGTGYRSSIGMPANVAVR
jgi:phage terminase large subunit-like protein